MRKRLYRVLIALTITAILFGVSACGNDTSESETFPTETESTEEPETESKEEIESESTEKEESVKEESQKEETKESDSKKESESKEESKAESSTKTTDTKESKTNNSSKTAESTPTPAPTTAPVHEHSYTSSVTQSPNCVTQGVRTFVCNGCGSSYTENIPCTEHNWREVLGEIYHEAQGEWQQVQVGTSGDVYTCCYCGAEFGSHSDITNHWLSYDDLEHAGSNYLIRDGGPIYEQQFIEISPAWTETVVTGYQCSVCGVTK